MENEMNNKKRNFFKVMGASAVGLSMTSLLGVTKTNAKQVSNGSNNSDRKFEVKIHPQSVKRTTKG